MAGDVNTLPPTYNKEVINKAAGCLASQEVQMKGARIMGEELHCITMRFILLHAVGMLPCNSHAMSIMADYW